MIAFGNCTIFVAVTYSRSQVSLGLETNGFGSFHLLSERPPPPNTNSRDDQVPFVLLRKSTHLQEKRNNLFSLKVTYIFIYPALGSW